ncbi:MAG: c-type cytochrome domain-containing protein, partial [Cyclobacteriaceae bacterium]
MQEFIGRLHPLLVHLPIGILLLAILFEWLPARKPYKSIRRSIRFILWIGFSSAVAAGLTGYILSQSGEYESEAVSWHQYAGIALIIFSFVYAWACGQKQLRPIFKLLSLVALGLLTVTGHLGGTLTHGEGYLTSGFDSVKEVDLSKVNLQQAIYYDDLVKPILESKCYGCHGSSKQKGKLRLDEPQHILKGGKDGVILVAGKVDESDMIDRMLLPLNDEDHMPPKEKKQLTEKEFAVLKAWIASGADFKKSVTESGQLAELENILSSQKVNRVPDVPEKEVAPADSKALTELNKLGVVIVPVAAGSNYLSANLINATALDSVIDLLVALKAQLVWLKAGNQPVTDLQLSKLSPLTSLTRLALEHTEITDGGIVALKSLTSLQHLNLNYTKVTAAGVMALATLKNLQTIYLYG